MSEGKFTQEEQEAFTIINDAIEGKITNNHAAKQLGLSIRQVQRLKAGVRKYGASAVVHKLKGKPSNHRYQQEEKRKVLETIQQQYGDFKPTFATEKLEENHGIHISPETTRLWMIEQGLWKPKKQKQVAYRCWRSRKEYFGELQQFDGSYHYWFENRYCDEEEKPIEVCLLASIDDATGQITKAMFAPHEGVIPVFTFWKEYALELGKPLVIYLDSFSTYKINHKHAVDNKELLTQFERASKQLSIQLITAHSPEAKGRVERLFGTLQDRLVKEMRLARINTPEEGNLFLRNVFVKAFNNKFAVVPTKEGNVHKRLHKQETEQLDHSFSIQETRRINLDFTIQFHNNWYQLTEIQPTMVRPLMIVLIETWLDGSVHITLKGHELAYTLLPERPKKKRIRQPIILTTHTLNYKPPPDHLWRRFRLRG